MGQSGRLAEGDILKLYINDFDEAMKNQDSLNALREKRLAFDL